MISSAYKIIYRIRNLFWKLFKVITIGVRIFALKDGKILLIRHTYKNEEFWFLPGGGLKRGEEIEKAVRREAFEETGIKLGELSLIDVYTEFKEFRSDHIVVYSGIVINQKYVASKEIRDIGFFPINKLPKNIYPENRDRIKNYTESELFKKNSSDN